MHKLTKKKSVTFSISNSDIVYSKEKRESGTYVTSSDSTLSRTRRQESENSFRLRRISEESESSENQEETTKYDNCLITIIGLVRPFTDSVEEHVYRRYKHSQITSLAKCLSFTGSLLSMTSIIMTSIYVHSKWRLHLFLAISSCIFHVVAFCSFHVDCKNSRCKRMFVMVTAVCLCAQICGELLIDCSSEPSVASKFEWILVIVYSVFVVFPAKYIVLLVISFVIFLLHSTTFAMTHVLVQQYSGNGILKQIAANFLYYIAAAISGSVTYILIDSMHRTSYTETRLSLETKKVIEEELQHQERLLTSVLPKHIAEDIMRDFGDEMDGPFRKMYMMRHENVSILFADIVGFTAMSSKCSAADLVKILNDLFASFDRLSQKFGQLRLKILGDCYYCICGVPKARKDHAALSVYMGLAMVDAIGFVRERTRTDVNMRVGIHTGAVLGGVLGQRQWQFDVLGKDVIIANKMESSGIPGRVHICHLTKNRLQGEFELEDAKVGSEHSFIRENGLQTFLVKSVLKRYRPSIADIGSVLVDTCKQESVSVIQMDKITQQLEYLNQLHVLSHNSGYSVFTLCLNDKTLESQYQGRQQTCPELGFFSFLVLLLMSFCGNAILDHLNATSIITHVITGFLMAVCLCIHQTRSICKIKYLIPKIIFCIEKRRILLRFGLVFLTTIVVICSNVTTLISVKESTYEVVSISNHSSSNSTQIISYSYPYYYTYTTVLLFIVLTAVTILDHVTKSILVMAIFGFHIVSLFVFFTQIFSTYDQWSECSTPSVMIQLCSITGILMSVIYLDRQMDIMSRQHFLTRDEIRKQRKKVIYLKKKNEALVYNILPPHVAKEFLGRHKQDNELYSHSYDDVGVMFAACPNFDEFYTETAVNKDGLECLRFLNEIISDYDELLKEERFKTVCKIKTIGSTYMVASGLDHNKSTEKSTSEGKKDSGHLDDLVQYAFAMEETLKRINAQSFNDFHLRIGINCGPVIAGVIGAKKPHYDIWGNTVNVASRMDSTCKLGKIQVVQEVKDVLEGFGYQFQQRGFIKVKGKGELLTYFLIGNRPAKNSSTQDNLQLIHDEDDLTLPNMVAS